MWEKRYAIFALILWLILTTICIRLYGPSGVYAGPFNSDTVIPVLMAQSRAHSVFSLYYWGQDRFGAWPFVLASAWSTITGWEWTAERLSMVMICWIMLGATAFILFSRPAGWVAALACGTALLLRVPVRETIFNLGFPYSWQFTLLVISALRLITG